MFAARTSAGIILTICVVLGLLCVLIQPRISFSPPDIKHLREAAPNVVKNTHFFGDNFVSIALIHVKFQSFDWRQFLCGQFRLRLEINQ